jgi:hypothetical protein
MFYFHVFNFIHLVLILAPGLISGTIVAWKTRQSKSFLATILASLAGSVMVPIATTSFAKLIGPIFPSLPLHAFWVGKAAGTIFDLNDLIKALIHYSIAIPLGIVTGAILGGMLVVAACELKQNGIKLSPFYSAVATVGSTIVAGSVCIVYVCVQPHLLGVYEAIVFAIRNLPMDGSEQSALIYLVALIAISLAAAVGGLLSALAGAKLATFLL